MNTCTTAVMLRSLSADHRERLMRVAHEVSVPQGARLFEEGGRADRFWIIRTGRIELDTRVPGRRAAVVENLGHDELVGWSWLFPPHAWHMGAEATTPVRAYEFDATTVRRMCREDPALGHDVDQWVGRVLAHRLRSTRTRLLDLYAPYGAGSTVCRPPTNDEGAAMHGTPHIVSDVMTQTVAAVGRGAAFKEMVQLMQDWKISALPVVEGEGRVVGVVSEADLLPKEEFRDSDPDRTTQLRRLPDLAKAGAVTAEELMTSPAFTVRPDATLAQAARTMARAKVKRLPVVDALGLLQGVVSRADLLKVFLRTDEEIAEEVRREVVSYLFPAPGSRVRVEVADGVVKLAGQVRDTSLVPVAARLIRAVEGVVDVDFDLTRHTDPTGPGDALGDDRPRAHGGMLPDGAPLTDDAETAETTGPE